MNTPLALISHALCPYVQRVAIVLHEKGLPFERRDIDLARKPGWFLELSPTGKTPVMLVGDTTIFESSVICEYLDETHEPRLHPAAPLARAQHRAWMEFASTVLAAIAVLYSAPTEPVLAEKALALRHLLERVEEALDEGPYFAGTGFSMVDAAFAPALRYFDVIEADGHFGFFDGLPKLDAWRWRLAMRFSVRQAVAPDYLERLRAFLLGRGTALSSVLAGAAEHSAGCGVDPQRQRPGVFQREWQLGVPAIPVPDLGSNILPGVGRSVLRPIEHQKRAAHE